MEILKAFVLNDESHDILIQYDQATPYFRASDVAAALGIKNHRSALAKFDSDEKICKVIQTQGGPQEVIFLTKHGMYQFLMKSTKEKAKPFKKWLYKVLDEIEAKGKYEIKEDIESQIQTLSIEDAQVLIGKAIEECKQDFEVTVQKEKHQALVDSNKGVHVTYFGLVGKTEDGDVLVKIGSTDDIKERATFLNKYFGTFSLIKIYQVIYNRRFEKFLHHHNDIKPYQYRETINNIVSTECFKLSPQLLQKVINIAKQNVLKFNDLQPDQLFEIKRLELEAKKEKYRVQNNILLSQFPALHALPTLPLIEDVNSNVPDVIIIQHSQKRKASRGFKVQKYLCDGTFVECFEGITEATRFCKGTSPTGMRDAINKRSTYHGFRWHFLSRDLPDDTVEDIGETIPIIEVKQGFIAFLTPYGDRIHHVFPDQKTAREYFCLKSTASICKAIKENTKTCGHLVKYYDDCSDAMKTEYLQSNILPEPPGRTSSRMINQIHPITKQVIRTYNSISDVIHDFPMSRITLDNAIRLNQPQNNFYWSECESTSTSR